MDKVDIQKLVGKNQTIKIVPSVEETMRGIGLNVDLDDNTKLWFEQLKVTWKTWKRSKAVENHVEQYLQTSTEPYRVTLVFVIKSEELKDCKPKSLPFFLMESLNKWASHNNILPEDSLKVPAFHIATQQRNQHFLNLVTKTYQLSTIKETIVATVRDMIKNDNCKQASQVVIAVELFDDISVEDLMFPLILQDKTNMIDEYLSECPSQVVPLLQFLDKLLDKSFNIREYVQTYLEEYKICNVKYDKLHYRPMGKLVARLCNKFNIHIETCKNLSRNRITGGLRFLIHQKYQGNNVSSSVWDDLVKDSLKQNIESGKEFIDMLADYDIKEALKWASYLRLPEQELPLALQDFSIQDTTVNEEENWEATGTNELKGNYYQSPLSEEQIIIIDTGEKFYNMILTDLAQRHVVSIDCEWKPSFGATHSQVALIQIATLETVYLIDSMVLNKQEYASFWYTFYKSLLDNAEIIKVGFGLEQDFKEMKASVIGLSNIKAKGEGLLDMSVLWKNMINSGLIIPGNSENGGSSLNSLVQACFGVPLEKSEQCSNWELRPLRATQIKYAALDAYVLIEIYNYLQRLCDEQRLNFEEICNDTMSEGKKKSIKKIKTVDRIQTSIFDNQTFCAQSLKLLVDPLLSNLMIYLRYCGIDTTVVSSSMLWHDVINLAISEERFIILEKLKCTPTVNYNQNSILHVGKGSYIELLQKIFTRFRLVVKQSDLMTRCINCNAKDFKHLQPHEVMLLCKEYIASSNYLPSRRYAEDDDDTNYDNFLSDSDCDEDLYQSVPNTYQNNKSCTTSKGTQIVICDVQKLLVSEKSATLCESCGRLYWDEDEMLLSTGSVIQDLIKLTVG